MKKIKSSPKLYTSPALCTSSIAAHRSIMALSLGGNTESDGTNLNGSNSEN